MIYWHIAWSKNLSPTKKLGSKFLWKTSVNECMLIMFCGITGLGYVWND